jgi:competence protein ComEA
MFGRRSSRDSDLATVAQRRLKALAQQFELASSRAGPDPAPDSSAANSKPADITNGTLTRASSPLLPDAARAQPGRHARPGVVRWWLTPHQVIVVTLLVVVGLLALVWWVLRSVPDPEPVQLTSERQLPTSAPTHTNSGAPPVSTPAGGASDPAGTGTVTLIVDVTGKVRRPGIVELPAGSRVIDALRAAGGARPRVDTDTLNLARVLVDGEQIVVGQRVPLVPGALPTSGALPALPGSTPGSPLPVNLNLATQVDLEALPGIGPVTATAILAWRTEHGGFSTVDELLEVSGIGEATLAEISPYIHV